MLVPVGHPVFEKHAKIRDAFPALSFFYIKFFFFLNIILSLLSIVVIEN